MEQLLQCNSNAECNYYFEINSGNSESLLGLGSSMGRGGEQLYGTAVCTIMQYIM